MRYLITLFLLVLHIASGGAQQAPTDVHGTWTAEIHASKANLQVRTSTPPIGTKPASGTKAR